MLRHESTVLEIESFATVSKTLELSGGRIYLYVGRRDVVGSSFWSIYAFQLRGSLHHWFEFILYSPNVNPMSNVICVNYHGSSCNLYEQVRLGEKMYELHARMTH